MGKWAAVEFRLSTTRKNIPYRSEPEEDIHPVIWLTKEPHRIDEIPELARDEELKAAMQALNKPGGRFETFRCLSQTQEDDGKHLAIFNIGLIYRDRMAFRDYAAQLMVVGELLGFAAEDELFPDSDKPFAVEIEPVTLTTEQVHGWAVDIWHQSYGDSPESAKLRANEVLRFVANTLAKTF